jgi:flagellar motor switch protein FliM
MENILTQAEIDALLKGIATGEVSLQGETPSQEQQVTPYDFSKHDRIVHGKIPAVDAMMDKFAHRLTTTLTSAIRRMAEVSPLASEVKKFRDFLKALAMPSSIHVFRVEPLQGVGLLVLEPNLVYLLIEFIMGGTPEGQLKIEGRDFTNIENRLIQRLVRDALGDLNEAWNSLEPVKIELERSEVNPQFAAVLLPSEPVLCIQLEVELELARGMLILCLPFTMLEQYRDRLPGSAPEREKKARLWTRHLEVHLMEAQVEVSVVLGDAMVPLGKIVEMKEGELLLLDSFPGKPLPVKVEGKTKLWAQPGELNGKRAVKIVKAEPS